MFIHYLKAACRNLVKNRTVSLINILGLSAGIAVFFLIFQYIAFEWSANRFHTHYDRLYRLDRVVKNGPASF